MKKYKPLISDAAIVDLYTGVQRARALRTATAKLRRSTSLPGSEAMLASLLHGLGEKDILITRSFDAVTQLLHGTDLATVWADAQSGEPTPNETSITVASTPAGAASFAAGAARVLQNEDLGKRGRQPVVLALLDRIDNTQQIEAALETIATHNLPCILVVVTRGAKHLRSVRFNMHGLPHIPVDARDPIAVYRVAQESLVRARTGLGGVLIEGRFVPGTPNALTLLEGQLKRRGIHQPAALASDERRFGSSLQNLVTKQRAKRAKK